MRSHHNFQLGKREATATTIAATAATTTTATTATSADAVFSSAKTYLNKKLPEVKGKIPTTRKCLQRTLSHPPIAPMHFSESKKTDDYDHFIFLSKPFANYSTEKFLSFGSEEGLVSEVKVVKASKLRLLRSPCA